ncbi:MAG: hypothetical protein PVG11_08535, partial [Anaerolineae bacterium]
PGAREAAGLPRGSGPYRVVTQLGVYGFDDMTRRLCLLACHPGITPQDVQVHSAFEILVPAEVPETMPPTREEQRLLAEIDPERIVLGR